MSDGLKNKTIHALFWSFLKNIGQQGIQFAVNIILARLLLPAQFGLIAMLWIFISIGQSIINSGFGQALVQKKEATYIDECSIFYFNIFIGVIMAGLMCLGAPIIAWFYKQPLLVPLTCVMSLSLIINSFGLIHSTLLDKHIDFKTQLKTNIVANVFGGGLGVVLAFKGFGVWSLVAQTLGNSSMRVILLWIFNDWRPALKFSFRSLQSLFRFGSRMLASGLLDTLYQNLYILVIGKLFSATNLGFYTRATRLQELPVSVVSSIVNQVTFPVFSSIQDNKAQLKRGVRKVLAMLMMINLPIMIGLAIMAKPVVLILLTEKWLPCVPYLQLLCFIGILYPLHVVNLNVLVAQGRSDLYFKLEILKKIFITIAIVITCRMGITAMIYGQMGTSLIAYFINSHYTGKLLEYPILQQVKDILPLLAIGGAMGGAVSLLNTISINNAYAMLSLQATLSVVIYIGLCYLFRISSFMEVVVIVRSKLFNFAV